MEFRGFELKKTYHSTAHTPPPSSLNGVPNERDDELETPQPAFAVWPGAWMKQSFVWEVPSWSVPVTEQLSVVWRDMWFVVVVWMPRWVSYMGCRLGKGGMRGTNLL